MSYPNGYSSNIQAWLFYDQPADSALTLAIIDGDDVSTWESPLYRVKVPLPDIPTPCWLALRTDPDGHAWAELWGSDPRGGSGVPIATVKGPVPLDPDEGDRLYHSIGIGNGGVAVNHAVYPIVFDDVVWSAGTLKIPPYPFARGGVLNTGVSPSAVIRRGHRPPPAGFRSSFTS